MKSAMRLFVLASLLVSGPAFAAKTSPLLKAAIGINAGYAARHTRAMTGVGLPKSVVEVPAKLVKTARTLAVGATVTSIGGEAASTQFYTVNERAIELRASVHGLSMEKKTGYPAKIVGGTKIFVHTDHDTGKATRVSVSDIDRGLDRELNWKDGAWQVTSEKRDGRTLSYKIVDGKVVR